MAYDKKAYNEWEKQFPDATEREKETVKQMYEVGKEVEEEDSAKKQVTAPTVK